MNWQKNDCRKVSVNNKGGGDNMRSGLGKPPFGLSHRQEESQTRQPFHLKILLNPPPLHSPPLIKLLSGP